MKLLTENGKKVLSLEEYGKQWGMNFVNSGCDEVMIDTGDNSAFEDFFSTLRTTDLTKESIDELEKEFYEDMNWAMEIEDGAREALLENGYKEEEEYFFSK